MQNDEQEQIAIRRSKLTEWRKTGTAFPNDFRRTAMADVLHTEFGAKEATVIELAKKEVALTGRLVTRRVMGKASFAHLRDVSGDVQLYIRRDEIGMEEYGFFKELDIGDIIGTEGVLFKTRSGELSVKVTRLVLLSKALRPMPEKFHGLSDRETRYRQRYLDLLSNEDARRVFRTRSRITDCLRQFLCERNFLEVETPMMHIVPGGAVARPFVTHHNALDIELYLRVAPELYLKRLVVGGFERVFEINRNFRNEGLSTQHNPEFTMLEFYQAYADYSDFMALTEEMFREVATTVHDSLVVEFNEKQYDLKKPFERMSVEESILRFNRKFEESKIRDVEFATYFAKDLGIPIENNYGLGKILIEIFEKTVEPNLDNPTFITEYPAEISPLSRRSDSDPFVTDRFELFIAGSELANGFSELNDAEDQAERFHAQVANRGAGDDEAMYFDDDYICALEHGLPPTAGEGVGVDRLVMFMTNQTSIRDVLLFPHMRPRN